MSNRIMKLLDAFADEHRRSGGFDAVAFQAVYREAEKMEDHNRYVAECPDGKTRCGSHMVVPGSIFTCVREIDPATLRHSEGADLPHVAQNRELGFYGEWTDQMAKDFAQRYGEY